MASPFDRYADLMFSRVVGTFGEQAEIIYRVGPAERPNQPVQGIFASSTVLAGDGMTVVSDAFTPELGVPQLCEAR